MIRPRKVIAGIRAYPLGKDTRQDKVRLDLNENNYGCPPLVIEAIRSFDPKAISVYPEYDEFKDMVAAETGLGTANILVSNGADDGIRTLMQTFIDPGDRIVMPVPTFGMIPIHAGVMGAETVEVVYNDDWSFPEERVRIACRVGARMVMIVNPASPLGTTIDKELIAELCRDFPETMILVDETYHQFSIPSAAELIREHENLVILQSFSKAWGLAGLRLGIILATAQIVTELTKVSPPFTMNTLAVRAGLAALKSTDHLEMIRRSVAADKKVIIARLEKLGIGVRDTAANFLLLKIGTRSKEFEEKCRKNGILIKDLSSQPLLQGYVRIALAPVKMLEPFFLLLEYLLSPPKVILFDMDGVLIDVSESYRRAIRETVKTFTGTDPGAESIHDLKQQGGYNNDWDLTHELIRRQGKEVSYDDVVKRFQEVYLGDDFDGTIRNERLLADPQILAAMQDRFKLGIVTGRPKAEAGYTLDHFKIRQYFAAVIGMEDVTSQKPAPDGIRKALENLDGGPACYLGDTGDDMTAALGAAIDPIGVLPPVPGDNTGAYREHLIQMGARAVLRSVNNVTEVL